MNVTRMMVVAGCLLLVGSALPIGAAHLAENSGALGSGTSAGFGGPAVDWDPCRRHSPQDSLTGGVGSGDGPAPIVGPAGDCSDVQDRNGVSGTYVTSMSVTVVECLGNVDDNPTAPIASANGTHADCDGLLFNDGWGAVGAALCDLEVGLLDGLVANNPDDETHVDNSAEPGGTVPDGTWDDGGFGGACHVSGYSPGDNNANTNPPNEANNATTRCEGTGYIEDWTLGADVPAFVSCDFAEFTSAPFPPSAWVPGLVNCAIGSAGPVERVQCAQNNLTKGLNQILNPPPTPFASCTRDSSADVSHLGKGGGHVGDGVTFPNVTDLDNATLQSKVQNNCTVTKGGESFVPGDAIFFVTNLVSANPFGQAYDDERDYAHDDEDEHFGWPGVDSDAAVPPSNWDNDARFDGSGDTIVYPATGGWVHHEPNAFTSDDANDNDDTIGSTHSH